MFNNENDSLRVITITAGGILFLSALTFVIYGAMQSGTSITNTNDDFYTETASSPTMTTPKLQPASSWESFQNVPHWFSFMYPEQWEVSTSTSNELVVRVSNPESAGEDDVNTRAEQFLVREANAGSCQSKKESSLANRDTYDTGWVTSGSTGILERDICFRSEDALLRITLSARNESSQNTLNRILNSFDFTARPNLPLTLKDIKSQYTDELLLNSAFTSAIHNNESFVLREPIKFTVWNQVGTNNEPLAVINLLHTSNQEDPTGYEVILFEIDDDYSISNPVKIDEGRTDGSYGKDSAEYEMRTYDTQGQLTINLEIRIPEIIGSDGQNRYIKKEFSRTDGKVVTVSDNQDSDEFFMSGIKAQYTDEFLTDPAFVKKGNMAKGGREFTVSNRTPKAYVFWDYNNDEEESLVVLNNASNIAELMLFDVDDNNRISNPRLIKNGGTASYSWRNPTLELLSVEGRSVLRYRIFIGQTKSGSDFIFKNGAFQEVRIIDGEIQ